MFSDFLEHDFGFILYLFVIELTCRQQIRTIYYMSNSLPLGTKAAICFSTSSSLLSSSTILAPWLLQSLAGDALLRGSVALTRLIADRQAEVGRFSDSASRANPGKKSAVGAVDSTQAATESRPRPRWCLPAYSRMSKPLLHTPGPSSQMDPTFLRSKSCLLPCLFTLLPESHCDQFSHICLY